MKTVLTKSEASVSAATDRGLYRSQTQQVRNDTMKSTTSPAPIEALVNQAVESLKPFLDFKDEQSIHSYRTAKIANNDLLQLREEHEKGQPIYWLIEHAYNAEALLHAARDVWDASQDGKALLKGPIAEVRKLIEVMEADPSWEPEMRAKYVTPAHMRQVTRATYLPQGGEVATGLMCECTYEIESHATELLRLSEELGDTHAQNVMRALLLRTKAMNSLLMSYLSDDTVTVGDADKIINGRATDLFGLAQH
jgi:hypothetical protein